MEQLDKLLIIIAGYNIFIFVFIWLFWQYVATRLDKIDKVLFEIEKPKIIARAVLNANEAMEKRTEENVFDNIAEKTYKGQKSRGQAYIKEGENYREHDTSDKVKIYRSRDNTFAEQKGMIDDWNET